MIRQYRNRIHWCNNRLTLAAIRGAFSITYLFFWNASLISFFHLSSNVMLFWIRSFCMYSINTFCPGTQLILHFMEFTSTDILCGKARNYCLLWVLEWLGSCHLLLDTRPMIALLHRSIGKQRDTSTPTRSHGHLLLSRTAACPCMYIRRHS